MGKSLQMKALALAGRVILENGGEIYRAEDTVLRMAQHMRLTEINVFCIPSGLFISYLDEDGERQTSINRMITRSTNLARVDAANQISRQFHGGELTEEELLPALKAAAALSRDASLWRAPLVSGMAAAAFCLMFDGGLMDMLLSGLCAFVTPLFSRSLLGKREGTVVTMLFGSFFCTMVPLAFHRLTGQGLPEAMIAGALMPLVPGLSMTTAVQDVMRGDMISGLTNGTRAVLVAALIASGAILATHLMNLMGGLL